MKAPQSRTRAEINRANAQHSTGPQTPEGKAASSGNSFKHGLYSTQLVTPGEDPAALDALKAALRAEHQPASTTEELLVNEIAEHFWRIRRYRRMEAAVFTLSDEHVVACVQKLLPLYQRFMSASERGLHKSLTVLRQLQKDRGFVPHSVETAVQPDTCEAPIAVSTASGFVPQYAENTLRAGNCQLKTAAPGNTNLTTGN